MKKHTNWAAIRYMARGMQVMAAATVYQMREQLAQLSAAIRADGERIAQMVVARHEQIEFQLVDELDDTERGAGGYGHTGVK